MFGVLLYDILFFAIPAILILFIGISFYRYRSAKKQNEEAPGTYSAEEIKRRKIMLGELARSRAVYISSNPHELPVIHKDDNRR